MPEVTLKSVSTPSGNHLLVVGGSKGLGLATVQQGAAAGWRVSVLARTHPAGGLPEGATFWAVDLRDSAQLESQIQALLSAQGNPSAVVFCQRFRGEGNAWDGELSCSLSATRKIVETLCGSQNFTDASMVFVCSIAGSLIAEPVSIGYHTAKAALLQMMRYYAVSLGPRGIRVNAVSPGTFLKAENRDHLLRNTELVEALERVVPLKRICQAQEVVDAIEFLIGSKSSFITGQNIAVDGGVSLLNQEFVARDFPGPR